MPPTSSEKHCTVISLYSSLADWEIEMVEFWATVFAGSMITPKSARVWNWVVLRICDPLNSHTTDLEAGTIHVYVAFSAESKAMNWLFAGLTVSSSGRRARGKERGGGERGRRERGRERERFINTTVYTQLPLKACTCKQV
jgi:hypothetical protein